MENHTLEGRRGLLKIRGYTQGDRCPSCSSDKDKGGRLCAKISKKKKYLKCQLCRYSVTRIDKKLSYLKSRADNELFKTPKLLTKQKEIEALRIKALNDFKRGGFLGDV